MIVLSLGLVVVLVAVNALFVATEFALLAARPSPIIMTLCEHIPDTHPPTRPDRLFWGRQGWWGY